VSAGADRPCRPPRCSGDRWTTRPGHRIQRISCSQRQNAPIGSREGSRIGRQSRRCCGLRRSARRGPRRSSGRSSARQDREGLIRSARLRRSCARRRHFSAFRLMARSNLVGCWTGRSDGFLPLRRRRRFARAAVPARPPRSERPRSPGTSLGGHRAFTQSAVPIAGPRLSPTALSLISDASQERAVLFARDCRLRCAPADEVVYRSAAARLLP
jgi:hypothetical protein